MTDLRKMGKVQFACGHWETIVYKNDLQAIQKETTEKGIQCIDCKPDDWEISTTPDAWDTKG